MAIANFDKVELLLPMTGENNGTIFPDLSLRNRAVTRTGAVTSTAQSKFTAYESSGYFDGYQDYLSVSGGYPFAHAQPFTLEGYVYLESAATYPHGIFCTRDVSDNLGRSAVRFSTTGVLDWEYTSGNFQTSLSGTAYSLDSWHHIAFVYDGANVNIYVNGVLDLTRNTGATGWPSSAYAFAIGSGFSGGAPSFGRYLKGFLADVAITQVAKYTADFTPPARMTQRTLTRVNTGTDSHEYDRAVLFDWNANGTGIIKSVTPDASGNFTVTDLIDLEYGCAFIKDGCDALICPVPVTVDAD